jgi:hypothetical protein
MKLLISTLTIIFISFGANAFNVEDLYKKCKPLQNSGFTLDNLNLTQKSNAVHCATFIRAILSMGARNCVMLQEAYKRTTDVITVRTLADLLANDFNISLNAAVTSFVIFAENNTQYWKYGPTNYVNKFIGKNYPCKLDK